MGRANHAEEDEVGDVLDVEAASQIFSSDVDGHASALLLARHLRFLGLARVAAALERQRRVVVVVVLQHRLLRKETQS